jgi:predicted  nucleic acid-binding Zn-ribbon protein
MSAVYNPETEIIARIERLELEMRDLRRKIEHARNESDRRVLNRQLGELEVEIQQLRKRLA